MGLCFCRERKKERDRQTGREMAKRPKKRKQTKLKGELLFFLNKDVTGARDGNRKAEKRKMAKTEMDRCGIRNDINITLQPKSDQNVRKE